MLIAGPWIKKGNSFVRLDLTPKAESPYPMYPSAPNELAEIKCKIRRGVATWTWDVRRVQTGNCRNKRECMQACDKWLQDQKYLILKQKHVSFI